MSQIPVSLEGPRGLGYLKPCIGADASTTCGRVTRRYVAQPTVQSGEPAGFLEAMFPDDGQSKDRHATRQNQPMAECQRMAV
jgi:hypothetical protein